MYPIQEGKLFIIINMYNTFQLDADEDFSENNSTSFKNHLNGRTDNKFMAGTITKNFFASAYDEEENDYMSQTSPSKREGTGERKGQQQSSAEGKLRREKKHGSRLAPISQSKQVEVYQNLQKNAKNEEIEDIDLASSEAPSQADLKKRSPRRRNKKEEQQHEVVVEKREEKTVKNEEIKLPPKSTQILFEDEDIEQESQKKEPTEQVSLPQKRINNEFVDSDDDDAIVVSTQQLESIVTGSEYFNFSNELTLIKQLYLDVRERTTLRMEIIRDKDGFNTFWPEFHLHFSEDTQYVMSAKKTSSRPTSTFIISRTRDKFQEEGPQYLGKMKSNVLGDVINIFGPGLSPSNAKDKNVQPRQLLATVVFITSLFQMGKPREFRLYIKKPEYQYYKHFPQVELYGDEIPLSTLAEHPENKDKIRVLHNRQPVWMKEIGGYMLNFRGRVERPSIKNFILEETANGADIMLFGKVNENKFTLDVSSRISTYIAFAVALSSFDSRLMCE